nr:zinc ribbon domain-containing protein [Candidatus Sigynarchaeum springense]
MLLPKKYKTGARAADFFWRKSFIFFFVSIPVFIGVGGVLFRLLQIASPSASWVAILIGFITPPLNGILAYACGKGSMNKILAQVHMDELIEKVEADPNKDLDFLDPISQEYARVEEKNRLATSTGGPTVRRLGLDFSDADADADADADGTCSPCPACGNTMNQPDSRFCTRCGARL